MVPKETDELENLERDFIVGDDMEKDTYIRLIKRVIKYAKVDRAGYVLLSQDIKFPIKNRVMIILVVRYLASKLQEILSKENTINQYVSVDELSRMSGAKKSVIMARAKDLKDDRKLESSKNKGGYRVFQHSIESFLDQLDKENP